MSADTEVFISYAHDDHEFATALRDQLMALQGVNVWFDDNLRVGDRWPQQIEDVLGRADVVVCLLSGKFFGSSYCKLERQVAFRRRSQGEAIVVPFFVRAAPLKGTAFQNYEARPKQEATIVPVEEWSNRELAYSLLAEELAGMLHDERTKRRKFWHVPRRDVHFVGRDTCVCDIAAALKSASNALPLVALVGDSGYGKTSIAVEYVQKNADLYDRVFWLAAQRPAEVARDFAEVSRKLSLPATGQAAATAFVRNYLAEHDRWLMVFDNAPDFDSLRAYLPENTAGHVLVTSRAAGWREVGSEIMIRPLRPAEARQFLLGRLDVVDQASVDQIATSLGYIPLDLELAARTMRKTGMDVATYATRLIAAPVTAGVMQEGRTRERRYTTATTTVAVDSLRRQSPEAVDLLVACSFLAPEDIPRHLLLEHGNTLPGLAGAALVDELSLSDAAAELGDYGLMQVDDDGFSIHRRIQASVRDSLTPRQQAEWASGVAHLLSRALPERPDDLRNWVWMDRLVPHATAVVEHLHRDGVEPLLDAEIRSAIASYLIAQGQLALAGEYVREAMKTVERERPESRQHAKLLNQMALVERELGHLNRAHNLVTQALDIIAPTGGDPDVGSAIPEEKSQAQQGVEQRPDLPDDADIAAMLRNLALISRGRGELRQTRQLLRETLRMQGAVLGPSDALVADTLSDIFVQCVEDGDLEIAKDYLRRALDILQRAYGETDHEVIIGRKLMSIFDGEGEVDLAARELLDEYQAFYKPRHPFTADAYRLLGSILENRGETAEAAAMFESAYDIDLENFGPQHFRLAVTLTSLMLLHAAEGRQADAEEALIQIVRIVQNAQIGEQQNTLRQTSLLRRLIEAAGQDETRPLIRSVEATLERAFPDNQDLLWDARDAIARSMRIAGDILLVNRRVPEAVEQYKNALRLALLTESDPNDDARAYARLGYAATLSGDVAGLHHSFSEAMGALAQGGYRMPVWGVLLELSQLHHLLGQPAEAQSVLDDLMLRAMEGGFVHTFRGEISSPVPEDWFAKESTTLLAPDGQANVIASAEPLDPEITVERYAEVQGEILEKEFPGYHEAMFEPFPMFGDRHGFVRQFEWTPPDGVPVTQIQIYYVSKGRGYTATATTPTSGFPDRELTLMAVLRGLRLGE
ncbi:MAG TPA: tetratricopeptide repeat protein [Solirubrobacteraceae bacterium]|nr:tetratricopeptide repeat protein [Solirubrobacteraceae bacterium]